MRGHVRDEALATYRRLGLIEGHVAGDKELSG
jgi:hypothetical protein